MSGQTIACRTDEKKPANKQVFTQKARIIRKNSEGEQILLIPYAMERAQPGMAFALVASVILLGNEGRLLQVFKCRFFRVLNYV